VGDLEEAHVPSARLKKPPNLLKNSAIEFYEEEKYRKSSSYDAYSREFGSKTRYFAYFKVHQFNLSTGWTVL
jgi:hypothetical protein